MTLINLAPEVGVGDEVKVRVRQVNVGELLQAHADVGTFQASGG